VVGAAGYWTLPPSLPRGAPASVFSTRGSVISVFGNAGDAFKRVESSTSSCRALVRSSGASLIEPDGREPSVERATKSSSDSPLSLVASMIARPNVRASGSRRCDSLARFFMIAAASGSGTYAPRGIDFSGGGGS
jgi:hypothetical protein